MKFFASLIFLLMTTGVFAVSVDFKFDVNSSGSTMYACNAGIRHLSYTDRICYDRETSTTCDPTTSCVKDKECNCICSGPSAQNGTKLDFLEVSSTNWKERGQGTGPQVRVNLNAPDTNFNMAFNELIKEEWDKEITRMSVNLGSERYGAEYFIDFCYRGPQIEYYRASVNTGSLAPTFALKVHATVSDLSTELPYSELADLKVKAEVVCDQQGKGQYIYAGKDGSSNANSYNQILTDITGISVTDGQYSKVIDFRDFSSVNNSNLIEDVINDKSAFTPRFCKIRYTFFENMRNTANPMDQIRKWQIQQAEVSTFADISETN
jgi:hypothetical protein